MKIVFSASEVFPFSKTGGLADVTGALSKELANLNNEVTVFSPLYMSVWENFYMKNKKLHPENKKIWVDVPDGLIEFEVWKIDLDGVEFLFLKNDELFFRKGFYNENGEDYYDNPYRFSVFSMAIMNYLKHHNINPDIIHCNDWQTALIPVYHKSFFSDVPAKTIITIHNLAFQGVFDIDLKYIGLDESFLTIDKLEFYGKVNFLKGGIVYSDFVTTVSPTYAKEIKTSEYGFGLDGLLRHFDYKLTGILNGIDYEYWNPATDEYIYKKYGEYENKVENKKYISNEYGFDYDKPLFTMVSRFTEQKGLNMITTLNDKFSELNANFIFLGDGSPEFNNQMLQLEKINPNMKIILGYNEALSHKLYAAADFYLMPSVFEPCGLSQMIAMRYGAVTVVRKTGGLNDTVKDISTDGYGFVFENIDENELFEQLRRAINHYFNKDFPSLSNQVMKIDFSWKKSAEKYFELYNTLINH